MRAAGMAVGNKQSCQIWHISNLPAEVEANGWVEVGVCGGEGEGGGTGRAFPI